MPEGRPVVLGICAMEKKTKSKPFKELVHHLSKYDTLAVVTFTDKQILDDPIEEWFPELKSTPADVARNAKFNDPDVP